MRPEDALNDPEIYEHLRALAARIHRERSGSDTLQPTALLHEAWMKLGRSSTTFKNRGHFLAVTARAMRQLLVDHARKRQRQGPHQTFTQIGELGTDPVRLLELESALADLEALRPEAAEVVTLRVFGGLTVDEVAEATGRSPRTVARAWRTGRAFLVSRLAGEEPSAEDASG